MIFRVLLAIVTTGLCLAQEAPAHDRALAAYRAGRLDEALAILNKELERNPKSAECLLLRGDVYSVRQESAKAIENYSEVIKLQPNVIPPRYRRAMDLFRAGRIKESIADFDKIAELAPDRAPQLWQRGICYYYAGEFEKGRKQFESHQTVNSHDVENAAWHFLCVAKLEGFEKAREQLIPITGDRRVPMMMIHNLFAGKAGPAEVLAAADSGQPAPADLRERLFYAHLYLGLFEEARGNVSASLEYMEKAAGEYAQKHYMGDVARVHLALRKR